jgi:hypothetical protein
LEPTPYWNYPEVDRREKHERHMDDQYEHVSSRHSDRHGFLSDDAGERLDPLPETGMTIVAKSKWERVDGIYFLSPPTRPSNRDSFETQRPLREGRFFWRIAERPILQKPQAFGIVPERLRTFDLVAPHHQIKNNSISAISASLR